MRYITLNLLLMLAKDTVIGTTTSILFKLATAMRVLGDKALNSWWPRKTANARTDIFKSTLLLLGAAGSGTGLHIDWTEALNLALAIDCSPGLCLALWLLILPTAVEEV